MSLQLSRSNYLLVISRLLDKMTQGVDVGLKARIQAAINAMDSNIITFSSKNAHKDQAKLAKCSEVFEEGQNLLKEAETAIGNAEADKKAEEAANPYLASVIVKEAKSGLKIKSANVKGAESKLKESQDKLEEFKEILKNNEAKAKKAQLERDDFLKTKCVYKNLHTTLKLDSKDCEEFLNKIHIHPGGLNKDKIFDPNLVFTSKSISDLNDIKYFKEAATEFFQLQRKVESSHTAIERVNGDITTQEKTVKQNSDTLELQKKDLKTAQDNLESAKIEAQKEAEKKVVNGTTMNPLTSNSTLLNNTDIVVPSNSTFSKLNKILNETSSTFSSNSTVSSNNSVSRSVPVEYSLKDVKEMLSEVRHYDAYSMNHCHNYSFFHYLCTEAGINYNIITLPVEFDA